MSLHRPTRLIIHQILIGIYVDVTPASIIDSFFMYVCVPRTYPSFAPYIRIYNIISYFMIVVVILAL